MVSISVSTQSCLTGFTLALLFASLMERTMQVGELRPRTCPGFPGFEPDAATTAPYAEMEASVEASTGDKPVPSTGTSDEVAVFGALQGLRPTTANCTLRRNLKAFITSSRDALMAVSPMILPENAPNRARQRQTTRLWQTTRAIDILTCVRASITHDSRDSQPMAHRAM